MMIPRSLHIRRLASVLAGALILSGCAARLAEPVGVAVAPSRPAAGTPIAARPGRPGFVVAAPRGGRDRTTDDMAEEIARRTGFGLVVGSAAYEQRVLEVAQGPLRFYAEIDDDDRRECAGPIEIATVGVDRELALRLRTLAELIRDAHLRTNREVQRLEVLVEPADPVASRGMLRLPPRGLHIELPRCARRDWRETYTAILADFLVQAVSLPIGR
jgi:hypothetical protein